MSNNELQWATKVACILGQAAQQFGADIDALESKWKQGKRIKKAFPKGILTLEEFFYVKDVLVNVQIHDWQEDPAEKDVGYKGGVYDVEFSITNHNGRAMPWLEKYVTESQYQKICTYLNER